MVSKTRKSKTPQKKQPATEGKSSKTKGVLQEKNQKKQRAKKFKPIKKQAGEKVKVKSLKHDTSIKNKQLLSNQILKLTKEIKIKDIANEIKIQVGIIKRKLQQRAQVFKSKDDLKTEKAYHQQLQKLGISDDSDEDQEDRMIAAKNKNGRKLSQMKSENKMSKNSKADKTQKQIANERKHKLYEHNELDYKEIMEKVQNLDTYLEVGLSFSHSRIRKETIIFNKLRERAQNERYS